jgi:hypothetical protein
MKDYVRRARTALEAAVPMSGVRPETAKEWRKALHAFEELAYVMYREAGLPKKKARSVAQLTHGGGAGMHLLSIAFRDHGND